MTPAFEADLKQIAAGVQDLLRDPANRPPFAPTQLLDAVLAYPTRGGKALRPALICWSCRALGGDERLALRVGLAVELYHTYTLVHDDVIDRDPVRRGKPSVHTMMATVGGDTFGLDAAEAAHYGLSIAILAGDCLQSWALMLLADLPRHGADSGVALALAHRLAYLTGPAIAEGEVRDIQLPFLPVGEVTHDEILRVILTKTSALFAYCGWAGGMIARGAEDDQVRALAAFGERAGIAFQLQDDVLGIVGNEAMLGKPIGSDLREGKRTMIIALAWERANEDERHLLGRVLGNQQATPEDVAAATALLQRLGAVDDVQKMADQYLDEAMAHLAVLPASAARDLLHETALRMVRRQK